MFRPLVTLIVAGLAVILGMAGLVRGSMPESLARNGPADANPGIVIGGAYVREPANDVNAAAYFTIFNTTGTDDVLTGLSTGAGASASVHTDDNGTMVAVGNLTVPAHGSVVFEPGKFHVMIDKLYGPLKSGTTVNLQLAFTHAGDVLVTAPVRAIGAPAPTAVAPK